ncbi:hypothetical protein FACS1894139_07980 [Planctomycetales bacterium]|nr:hypothetical protein FACS1894107_00280 [Planctomycetales bacterium]GHS96227.1 hypothetical protein FACS1894108_00500 [Planctomycetales bacterium]GHT04965.1 hypothetical protein FACS1894139_07980 [Planctomycetales bacterium]
MGKQKPCKALVRRVRVTKNGKVVAKPCGSVHRRAIKSPKRRRQLRRVHVLDNNAAKIIKKMLVL